MISEETIWEQIWPVVAQAIEATLAEDEAALALLTIEGGQATDALELYGFISFDILLKTVLGRSRLGLTKAVETDNGRFIYIEFAWTDGDNGVTAVDLVTVCLTQQNNAWRIVEINPAAVDAPLNSKRAQAVLTNNQLLQNADQFAAEPWILPYVLYAGLLQLPLQNMSQLDAVEKLLFPGLQQRGFGLMAQLYGRQLWRDFLTETQPELTHAAAWAAALEFLISEQHNREVTQAAVSKHYQTNLAAMVPNIRKITKTLDLQNDDARYSDLHTLQIEYTEK